LIIKLLEENENNIVEMKNDENEYYESIEWESIREEIKPLVLFKKTIPK
jgi:hypothetical protein